jgi:AcrR family transcriptional regulator
VTSRGGVRAEQRAASEAAILDAAWELFARRGPDGASLRDVAAAAGCTHALVTRYYGSKQGLAEAVADLLARRVELAVTDALVVSDDPLLELVHAARRHRRTSQLLIRSALGDLPARGVPECFHLDEVLACPSGLDERRTRLCAYAAGSVVMGFVTFEEFLVAATRLRSLAPRRRDLAVAAAAHQLLALAPAASPELAVRELVAPGRAAPVDTTPVPTSRDALLGSAIELFAQRGPASVSVRDIAAHAGINQGLIHRHFGSKAALLAEVLEQGSSGMFPAALSDQGFDFDAMSWLLHHESPAPRLIARTLVDGIDISSVRRQFPILRRLVDDFDGVPSGAGPGDLSDPRVAVVATAAMALGSAIWGEQLRTALGLGPGDGVEAAIADLARFLVSRPLVG